MKNYTWTVDSLYTEDIGTELNYVVDVIFTVSGEEVVDGKTYSSILNGNALKFDVIEQENFIAYADLTNEVVAGWVKEKLGEILVSNLEASVGAEIDLKVTPPTVPTKTALPW